MSAAKPPTAWRNSCETTPQQLAAISDDDAARRAGPDRWAPKEILGHLIDSAANNHQRFVRGQLFAAVDLPSYEQESWVKTQNYVTEPWPDLINLWLLFNRHLLHLMRNRPRCVFTNPYLHRRRRARPALGCNDRLRKSPGAPPRADTRLQVSLTRH